MTTASFAFVVDRVAAQLARQHDRRAGMRRGRRGLHEQHRLLGDRVIAFFGVLPVVEADAEDVGRMQRGEKLLDVGRLVGVAQFAEQVAFQGAWRRRRRSGCRSGSFPERRGNG